MSADEDRAAMERHLRAAAIRHGVSAPRAAFDARSRALVRLAGMHIDDYRALYRDELTRPRRDLGPEVDP